jgi:DNA-cytosine methyltransferase
MNTAVTLFSGVGCSSLALQSLGYEVTAHEFNPNAAASLRANGIKVVEGDVRDVDFTVYAGATVVEGGPPCQPFSQAHDGDGQFDPRDMIPEFIRAVAEIGPEVFVMEEVQTLTWAKHRAYLAKVIDALETLGYRVEARVLNAADHGSVQARKRLFVVGVRLDLERPVYWPVKVAGPTMAAFLGWNASTCVTRNLQVPDERAHAATLAEWPMHRSAMTVVGSFRPEVMAAPGYRKAGDPPRQATPGSVVVTEEERKRLMGLPADWIVVGNQAARDLQIGNGVVVGLMRVLVGINTTH